jgi:hypothetical protein
VLEIMLLKKQQKKVMKQLLNQSASDQGSNMYSELAAMYAG